MVEFDLLSDKILELDPSYILLYHSVQQHEIGRPDLIALKYYSDPKLYWFILKVNGITSSGFTTRKKFKIDYTADTEEENTSGIFLGQVLVILKKEYLSRYMRS